jgi:type II secretory pathway pseudopilin PulG
MNRGCHWAWVDKPEQEHHAPTFVNQFDQAMRERIAAQRREKELREQQQFAAEQQREAQQQQRESEDRRDARVKAQNNQANDLEILKAVHEGVLAPVAPEDHTTSPTIKNSSGQEFRVVTPAPDHPTLPADSTDTNQYFTQNLLNGRMWVEVMTEPERVFYVASFLQGYAIACLSVTDDDAQQKACYRKLGDPAHTNPVDPQEIVEGVDKIFASADNRGLIIPIAIKAASMKASGEPQDGIDKFLQTERGAVTGPAK